MHGRRPGTFSSHIVRAEVWALLQGKNCPVEFDDVPRVMTMGQVANEGLATRFNDIDIKINKGELLPAATTDARKLFYQHQDWNLWVNSIIPEIKSLVVLWDCDVNGNNLKLYLVCPKNAKGDWEWQERIPHPAEWLVIPPTDVLPPTSSGGDLDELVPITTEKEIKG